MATAFSSIGIPNKQTDRVVVNRKQEAQDVERQSQQNTWATTTTTTTNTVAAVASTAPWRLALNIGREPMSSMPMAWARSGCRMPIVVRCDVSSTYLQPQLDTISFTGVDGAVVLPVLGGTFQLDPLEISSSNSSNNQRNQLSFALTFPEAMARRDVTIDAGTTLYCTGTYYTQAELDWLNQAYYEARNTVWTVDNELRAMTQLDGPSKRWNDVTQQWERRNNNVNPLAWAQKQVQYRAAQAKEREARERRPDPNSLSERGTIPGVDGAIYVVKEGLIKSSPSSGAVMGRWSMEPMLIPKQHHRPVSHSRGAAK